ncbi:signal peptidase II [Mucilaginibacter agri]|uniref:Lipoprotein signal peptidase n=1 Tax=Mucilaginibacter agri TaxID=2695265 RepID=A0A965ZGF8_9SPHI|nr:signal peptidase II [Mucilaginibacter agri]NCD69301.1 signal peptidase II [Mucilaginibacter agri]
MKVSKPLKAIIIITIVLVNVGCDQLTKAIVRSHVEAYASFRFFGGHFMLTRVENTGAFLSLGDQIPGYLHAILLSIIPAAFLVLGIWYLIQNNTLSKAAVVAICCMIGGGAGNVFDRIIYGSVTDFLYIDFGGFLHTGVFNVADISITTGVIIMLIDMIKQRRKAQPISPEQEA